MAEIDRSREINIASLRELISYDAKTGALVWRQRDRKHFTNDRNWKVWNGRFAGRPTGHVKRFGYVEVSILRVKYAAHRVAYALHYGRWPTAEIDHIDGNQSNNRIENLRDVSRKDNSRNLAVQRNNTSGVAGVSWQKKSNKWHAYITVNRKQICVGFFDDLAQAKAARIAAQEQHKFHPNHGRNQ